VFEKKKKILTLLISQIFLFFNFEKFTKIGKNAFIFSKKKGLQKLAADI
jgi:hypothetical protein